jgi:hypothetical protein
VTFAVRAALAFDGLVAFLSGAAALWVGGLLALACWAAPPRGSEALGALAVLLFPVVYCALVCRGAVRRFGALKRGEGAPAEALSLNVTAGPAFCLAFFGVLVLGAVAIPSREFVKEKIRATLVHEFAQAAVLAQEERRVKTGRFAGLSELKLTLPGGEFETALAIEAKPPRWSARFTRRYGPGSHWTVRRRYGEYALVFEPSSAQPWSCEGEKAKACREDLLP